LELIKNAPLPSMVHDAMKKKTRAKAKNKEAFVASCVSFSFSVHQ